MSFICRSIFLALNIGMQKILCVGDGFGKGHVWPMWPQLLPEIVNDTEIVNLSEVGAGNEYISQCVIDSCERENYDLVIVQWAKSNRLDLINNEQKDLSKKILQDNTYNTKYSNVKLNDRLWWLSSASEIDMVKQYHENYISKEQHKLRTVNFINHIDLYLSQKQIKSCFFSSYNLDFLDITESQTIDWSKWLQNGEIGMYEYGVKHLPEYKSTEVQPHTLVHLDYLEKVLCPFAGLKIDNKKLAELKTKHGT